MTRLILALLATAALGGCAKQTPAPTQEAAPPASVATVLPFSYVQVVRDPATGCEYLVVQHGGLAPRMTGDYSGYGNYKQRGCLY